MNFPEIHHWYVNEEQKRLAKLKAAEQDRQANIERLQADKRRKITSDIQNTQHALNSLQYEAEAPKLFLQNSLTRGDKDKWSAFGVEEIELESKCKRFQSFLLHFGKPVMSIIGVVIMITLGIFFVWATLGLDAVGGNQYLTIGIAVAALICIDVVGYTALAGMFACLENFMAQSIYKRTLEVFLTAGFVGGLICFVINIFLRLKEFGA